MLIQPSLHLMLSSSGGKDSNLICIEVHAHDTKLAHGGLYGVFADDKEECKEVDNI